MDSKLPPTDSSSALTPGGDLPPVTPPSAGFILQLFLVPALLVTLVIAFIWLFFGWLGGGPRTPEEFLDGLRDPSELRKWKTAEHLAQVLKRDDQLAGNAGFALDLGEILWLKKEQAPPAQAPEKDQREKAPDLAAEFLPAALGNFYVPVGVPLFHDMIEQILRDDPRAVEKEGYRLRLRNAVWALALLGEKLKRYESLPPELKESMRTQLQQAAEAPSATAHRRQWARLALDYLNYLPQRQGPPPELFDQVMRALRLGSQVDDELTRSYTVLALAMWDQPAEPSDLLLRNLADSPHELIVYANDRDEQTRERGRREIRYNAALVLARRGSPLTPWHLVEETLSERTQRELNPNQESIVVQTITKALGDVAELKRSHPDEFDRHQQELQPAVQALTESPHVAIRVAAKRVLGISTETDAIAEKLSRHTWLILGVGIGVVLLLFVAVTARWRRGVPPPAAAHEPAP
jgi:hypothetical protein